MPSTATPIPEPSCCSAFSVPEADPASASVTAPMIVPNAGTTNRPMPIPTTSSGPASSQVLRCETYAASTATAA